MSQAYLPIRRLGLAGVCDFYDVYFGPIIVYQMGRLCGGAHEISGIRPQFFSVGGGLIGWVVVGWGWVGRGGRVGGGGVGAVEWRGGGWCD